MKLESVYSTTAEKAREQAEDVLASARSRAKKVSGWADAGKKPVRKFADLGLKLSAISHSTSDNLLKKQADVVEGEFGALAEYFDDVAASDNFKSLARLQLSLLPRFTRRTLENSRETLSILGNAGKDVRELAAKTLNDIRKKPAAKKSRKAKTATGSTKKAAAAA